MKIGFFFFGPAAFQKSNRLSNASINACAAFASRILLCLQLKKFLVKDNFKTADILVDSAVFVSRRITLQTIFCALPLSVLSEFHIVDN